MHDSEPRQLDAKPARRGIKPSDIVIAVVLIVVIALLANTLKNQLDFKHEVASAHTATDGFLADIRKQDAASAYKFGNTAFQQKYTQKELANLFKSLSPLIKKNPATVKQTATNGSASQVVSIYYQFGSPTYYFATTVIRPNGTTTWRLLNFSGSPNEAGLFKTQ